MKVISFSLWGKNPKYCVGAVKNADLARQIYPGWVSRFYCAQSVPDDTTIGILQHGHGWKPDETYRHIWRSHDDLTEIYFVKGEGDWRNMFDRFLPGIDPKVDVFISRDCDSRLSLREKAAVDEWLESPELIHSMRDHPCHSVPILGGMWGMKHGAISDYEEMLNRFAKENRLQTDQEFLAQYVYPSTRRIMHHDNGYFTHFWGGRPFPTPRNGLEFVGQVFDENDVTVAEHQELLRRHLR